MIPLFHHADGVVESSAWCVIIISMTPDRDVHDAKQSSALYNVTMHIYSVR